MAATYQNHRAQIEAILVGWGMPSETAEKNRQPRSIHHDHVP